MHEDVGGAHIVITGASGRLGRVLVDAFAKEGAVVSAMVRPAVAREDFDFDHHQDLTVHEADLTDSRSTRHAFDEIVEQKGVPNAVIHTVGTWAMTPVAETSWSDWQAVVDTNLKTTFICFREATRVMADADGVLIAFGSGQGADRGIANQSAYAAAKAGVIRLMESLDAEYGETGIRSHVIAPSYILYDETEDAAGVRAGDLAQICIDLCAPSGRAMRGTLIRAYGTLY